MTYGILNEHSIGLIMQEAVRRAIREIRSERFIFETRSKAGPTPGQEDLVTSADLKAQAIYLALLQECFPRYGIVAEENGLSVPCRLPERDIWFTVDPLDGTRAFGRLQSHGIGTMISLISEGDILAVAIGDVMTQELYYYRPGSTKVHRISEFVHGQPLEVAPRTLRASYVLLRNTERAHSRWIQDMVKPIAEGGLFDGIEVTGGSIGISMARLWKGEVGAAVLRPGAFSPWDLCPVLGISHKLGFVPFAIEPASGRVTRTKLVPDKQAVRVEQETLWIHASNAAELERWVGAR